MFVFLLPLLLPLLLAATEQSHAIETKRTNERAVRAHIHHSYDAISMFSVHHFKLSTFSLLNIYKANIAIAEKDTEEARERESNQKQTRFHASNAIAHNDESNCTNDIQTSIHQY